MANKPFSSVDITFFLFWGSLIAFFGSSFIYWSDGTLWVKGVAQWMDIPVHEAYMQHFINRPVDQWFSVHPLNIDADFTYHFLPDLISAYLYKAGLNITWSLALPVVVTSYGFIYEGYYFFKKRHGDLSAALTISSVFLFGGIGFLYRIYSPEYFISSSFETSIFKAENNLFQSDFPNIFTNILFSQRGIPFGLWLFFFALRRYENINLKNMCSIMLANAIMMVSMIHGSIALLFYLGTAFLFRPNIKFAGLISLLFIESLFIYLSFFRSSAGDNYIGLIFGLYYGEQPLPWLRFWFCCTFLLLPLAAFFSVRLKKYDINIAFATLMFVLINLIKFQPNMWDNIKIFIFSLPFLYEPIIVGLLAFANGFRKYFLIVATLISLWGSGAWDIYEIIFTKRLDYPLYSESDVRLAEKLKKILSKNSSVIIENKHNHMALQLMPNHPLLGFQFNLDTYGHHYRQLKDNINFILEGGLNNDFLRERNVSAIFIVKGPLYDDRETKRVFVWNWNADEVTPNLNLLFEHYSLIAENEHYLVFSTTLKNDIKD